jgi:hypothetical protein
MLEDWRSDGLSPCAPPKGGYLAILLRYLPVGKLEGFRAPMAYGCPRSTNREAQAVIYGCFGFRLLRGE